jgi:hypothetical protein
MAGTLNAKVIMAKCSKTKKAFGIRIEERGHDWVRTWAFKIDERKAKREDARRALQIGLSIDQTAQITGLSLDEIAAL